ncbi:hypothetical protein J3458_002183 [Metarhizium acridum]|uniref:uncharacterized protein n=1 Tax=Metarhizium acridum TaxID=92637 RepID=UPI001C6BBD4C|nr:hypothetical protein J3458_002183 [Metarhizium acridum]
MEIMDATNTSKTTEIVTETPRQEEGLNEKSNPGSQVNLVYSDASQEPEIHLRTYIAVVAMLVLSYVQIIALQGPPLVASETVRAVPCPSAKFCFSWIILDKVSEIALPRPGFPLRCLWFKRFLRPSSRQHPTPSKPES